MIKLAPVRSSLRRPYSRVGPGSTIALTDETAQLIESYTYTTGAWDGSGETAAGSPHGRDSAGAERLNCPAFGTASIYDASGSALSASLRENRFLFTGRDHRRLGSLEGDSAPAEPAGRDNRPKGDRLRLAARRVELREINRERTRQWLAPLGLYDYRNRTYSPTLGRFIQTDPIRFAAGEVNLYRYVDNDPVNWVDLMGLWPWWANPSAGIAVIGQGLISQVDRCRGYKCAAACLACCSGALIALAGAAGGLLNAFNSGGGGLFAKRYADAIEKCEEDCRVKPSTGWPSCCEE